MLHASIAQELYLAAANKPKSVLSSLDLPVYWQVFFIPERFYEPLRVQFLWLLF